MPKKQSSDRMSKIASQAMRTGKATKPQIRALGASVLSQDEKKGKRKP